MPRPPRIAPYNRFLSDPGRPTAKRILRMPSSPSSMKHAHQIHRERRDAVLRTMRERGGGGLAVVPTAPEVPRNRDSYYPYRPDSYFYLSLIHI